MKIFIIAICWGLLVGCSRPPPFQQKIEADTPISFAMWRSKNGDALTQKEWSLFNQALEELKLKIMLDGQASGGEAVDLALRSKIDGMQLGEVMQSGLKIRLKRLTADKTVLEESLAINSQMKLKSDDEEKARMLAEKVQSQSTRLAKLRETVAEAEADLHELELKCK